jgi:hypothetical protein
MRALFLLAALLTPLAPGSAVVPGGQQAGAQPVPLTEHRDAQGRFRFAYPRSYGATSPGTNDGFNGRISVRFASPPALLGGELVLTRGFPYVDLQAVGGLYDSIALEVLPDPLRSRIVAQLPRLNAANFCDALGRATHLDVDAPSLASLTAQQRAAIRQLDLVRSIDVKVARCGQSNGVIVFHRVVRFQEGAPYQQIFGAIRFLNGDVSSVQMVAGAGTLPPGLLDEIAAIVRSLTIQQPR